MTVCLVSCNLICLRVAYICVCNNGVEACVCQSSYKYTHVGVPLRT